MCHVHTVFLADGIGWPTFYDIIKKIRGTIPNTPSIFADSGHTNMESTDYTIHSDIGHDQAKTVNITKIVLQVKSGLGPGHLILFAWIIWPRPGLSLGLVQAVKITYTSRPRPGLGQVKVRCVNTA